MALAPNLSSGRPGTMPAKRMPPSTYKSIGLRSDGLAEMPLNTETLYLDLTFITLAMLVIGGATSLWGAVVGALAVSALDSFLAEAENGITIAGRTLDLPAGTRIIVVGSLMALVLILRPAGLTGGRELSLPRIPRRSRTPEAEAAG